MNQKKSRQSNGSKTAWIPYLTYGLLSLAILGPLLFPGYVLTLDMIHSPNMNFMSYFYGLAEKVSAEMPFLLFQQLGSELQPGWLFQKVVLFLIFFLSGLGAHELFVHKGVGAYFAGILYMINPFTYVRFLAGQWGVLAAYAMTPFAIKAFMDLLQKGGRRNVIKVALVSTLVGVLQLHGLFLLLLTFLIIFVVRLAREHKALPRFSQICKYVGISAGLFCLLNLYWLVPVLTDKSTIIGQIGRADLLFFAPKLSSTLGIAFDTASMYGFWRGGYVYAKDFIPIWWLLFMFLLFLATYGFLSSFNDKNQGWVIVSFGAIGIVSFLLALGISAGITRPPFEWLWEHVAFLRGFRDSQKFVALLCLSYAYLGGVGVNEMVEALKKQGKRLIQAGMTGLIAVALLTPVAYSFTMFGFHGQLRVTDYPQEWYEVNEYLNQDKDNFNILFLPWHQYMDYSWLPNRDKRLFTPAQQFFNKPVIQGDNIEVPGIYSQSTNPVSKYVEFLLSNGSNVNNLGELLAPLNVKYIILVYEADYKSYEFLYQQEDVMVEMQKAGITLFRNEHPTARVYGVDSVVYVKSLEEYLELSTTQNIMEHLYIIGNGLSDDGNTQMEKLSFVEKNPATYIISGTSHKYTIFTLPQNVSTKYWEYNSETPPLQNLGFMPAFKSEGGGGEIVYSRFYHIYLPSYVVSVIVIALMIYFYLHRPKRKVSS